MHTGSLLVVGAITALGAASRYAPHTTVVTTPHGTAAVSSYGLALVDPDPQPLDAQPIMTMHVRAELVDTGDAPWSVDVSTASLVLPDGPNVHALAVNADAPTLPYVAPAPGERLTVDFYFPTPASVYDDADLPAFAVDWLGMRTRFSRVPQTADVVIDASASHGRVWWFDPGHAWPSFHHVDGVITPSSPSTASVAWLQGAQNDPDEQ